MKTTAAALAATLAIGIASPAFAQSAGYIMTQPYPTEGLITGRSIGFAPTLGRFSKTPTGNFNSTRSIEEHRSSGQGSGDFGGNPNGN